MIDGPEMELLKRLYKSSKCTDSAIDNALFIIQNFESEKNDLEALYNHHEESYVHSLRVGIMCCEIGCHLEYTSFLVALFGTSGFLHDIGKLEVPKYILNKNGKPKGHELDLIREHPKKSYNRVTIPYVKQIIVAHHEHSINPYPRAKNNGNGHERRNGDYIIDDMSQFLAIVDTYDALVNKRAYKNAKTHIEALKTIENEFYGNKDNLRIAYKVIDSIAKRININ